MAIEIRDRKILIDGEPFRLLSGELHYWRHDPTLWERLLAELVALGLTAVSTYVPWSIHESASGRFDFGRGDPRLDVGRFLDLAAAAGLRAIVRPGPHVNAELTRFGYPARLFEREEILARTAQGTAAILPVPPRAFACVSYASEAFLAEVGAWYRAVGEVLAPRLSPAGPVIAVQVDNEMSYFFRTSLHDLDYSDGALAQWRAFLVGRGLEPVDPPREFDRSAPVDLGLHLQWAEFKEAHLAGALGRLRRMLEDAGVRGVLFTHNYPPARIAATPFHLPAAERVLDVQGLDIYNSRRQYDYVKRNVLYLEGTSRYPFVPEMSAGSSPWIRPIELADSRFLTLAALMHGAKGINFYMAVERERWYGAPVSAEGRRREEPWRSLAEAVALHQELGLDRARRRSDLLLVLARDYLRTEAATEVFAPLPPAILDDLGARAIDRCLEDSLGLPEPAQIVPAREWESWYWTLTVLGIPFALGDSESDLETWARHRVLVVPTSSFLATDTQRRLLEYAAGGGTVVVGPRLPDRDLLGGKGGLLAAAFDRAEPAPGAGRDAVATVGRGRLVRYGEPLLPATSPRLPVGLDREIRLLLSRVGMGPLYPAIDDHVDTAWHEHESGGVLFVANPTEVPRRAAIRFDGRRVFRPAGGGAPRTGEGGWQFDMGPYTIAAFHVEEG